MYLDRRQLMLASGIMAAVPLTGMASSAIAQAGDLQPIRLPPPIGREERIARLARARSLMQANDIGAIIVESGASLDYFTGVQWWGTERLTAAGSPAAISQPSFSPFRFAETDMNTARSRTRAGKSKSIACKLNRPASIFDRSSTSLMIARSVSPLA